MRHRTFEREQDHEHCLSRASRALLPQYIGHILACGQQFPVSHFVRKNRGIQKTLFANSCTVFLLANWSSASEITGVSDCVTKLTLLNISGNCWPVVEPGSEQERAQELMAVGPWQISGIDWRISRGLRGSGGPGWLPTQASGSRGALLLPSPLRTTRKPFGLCRSSLSQGSSRNPVGRKRTTCTILVWS